VDVALKALGVADNRVRISGPDLQVKPKPAISLSMALHELGTNALKYGSLTGEQGRVVIQWAGIDDSFRFSWEEQGGPPPAIKRQMGFGTRMIELVLAAELNGSTELRFSSGGLTCEVVAPLDDVAERPVQNNHKQSMG
jgi:two-component sensor histidine kinase